MDLRKLKKLIDLVEESGISELEITEGESRVRIVKQTATPSQHASLQPSNLTAAVQPAPLIEIDETSPCVKPAIKAVAKKAG